MLPCPVLFFLYECIPLYESVFAGGSSGIVDIKIFFFLFSPSSYNLKENQPDVHVTDRYHNVDCQSMGSVWPTPFPGIDFSILSLVFVVIPGEGEGKEKMKDEGSGRFSFFLFWC